jgi:hypothetical protein
MRKGKILMLLDNPFTSDSRVNKEALSLIKADFHVTIVCTKQNGLAEEENIDGIEIKRWIGNFYMHPLRRSFKIKFKEFSIKLFELNLDILHCHDYMMLNLGGRIKEQKPEIFLTYDSHEYFRGWRFYKDLPSFSKRFKGYLVWSYLINKEEAHLNNCNAVITTTRPISQRIKSDTKIFIEPIAVENIPLITNYTFKDFETNLRKKFCIREDEFCMVQSGNIYQSKELILKMIDAVIEMPLLHLIIINNRPISKELKHIISQNKIQKQRIHFVDYDQNSLIPTLTSADFGIMHTNNLAFDSQKLASPNRVYDYGLAGLPFISTPQYASERIAIDYKTVEFYECEDIPSFKSAINRMIDTLPEKKKNAERIKYSLSWDAEFAPVVELYKKVAARLSA